MDVLNCVKISRSEPQRRKVNGESGCLRVEWLVVGGLVVVNAQ